jgi:hypothetical protein
MQPNRRETVAPLASAAIAPMVASTSFAQVLERPEAPPRNPFLANSNYSMVHANSGQTDSTVQSRPSRDLEMT